MPRTGRIVPESLLPMLRDAVLAGALLLLLLLANACGGDTTASTGELGRLRYSLFTDYEVPESELTRARIVTGHRQTINVSLTRDGREDARDPARISHRIEPSTSATISTRGGSEDSAPGFDVTIGAPGRYTIESMEDGELFDRIQLQFETPAGFDLLLQTRAPYAEGFDTVRDESVTLACEEGTQITVDAAPLDATGDRLAGRMQTTADIDPRWMAVPGVGVIESFEDSVWSTDGQANFYFVEPGTATLTVSDPVSQASQSATFEVTPINRQ